MNTDDKDIIDLMNSAEKEKKNGKKKETGQKKKSNDIYTNSSIVTPQSEQVCDELKDIFIEDMKQDNIDKYLHKKTIRKMSKSDAKKMLEDIDNVLKYIEPIVNALCND